MASQMKQILKVTVLYIAYTTFTLQAGTIAYQGLLLDSKGDAVVDSTYVLFFELFAEETGGVALWQQQQKVSTEKGLFFAQLGEDGSMEELDFSQSLWLAINREGTTPSSRVPLLMPPYATRASDADTANWAQRSDSTIHALRAQSAALADTSLVARHSLRADSASWSSLARKSDSAQSAVFSQQAARADSAAHAEASDTALHSAFASVALSLPDSVVVARAEKADTAEVARSLTGLSEALSQKADVGHEHDYSAALQNDPEQYFRPIRFMGTLVASGEFVVTLGDNVGRHTFKLMQYSLPLEGFLHVKVHEVHPEGNTNSSISATYHIQAVANNFSAELVGNKRQGSGHRESNSPPTYNPRFDTGPEASDAITYNRALDFTFEGLPGMTYKFWYSFRGL